MPTNKDLKSTNALPLPLHGEVSMKTNESNVAPKEGGMAAWLTGQKNTLWINFIGS